MAEEQALSPQETLLRSKHSHFSVRPELFRRHGGNKVARAITELCNNPELFEQLHCYFTWMLKNCTSRMFERQLEGPNQIAMDANIPMQTVDEDVDRRFGKLLKLTKD